MIVAFIDEQRAKNRAVESICQVLREQGLEVAARTYRAWKRAEASARDRSDAVIIDALLATATMPESMYGRRKMTAFLRRQGHDVSARRVDRLMRHLGLNGRVRGRGRPGRRICWTGTSPHRPRTNDGSRTSPTSAPGPGSPTCRS